jgi:NitT/TauT family transport system substrate-binding protein
VKIVEGKGSSTGIQLVANGVDTFAFADAAVAAKAASQGMPVKVVMGLHRKATMGIVFPANRGIRTPQDLKGKTISVCAGDSASVLLPAYLKAVSLSLTDVKLLNVECSAKHPMVAQGRADASPTPVYGGKGLQMAAGVKEVASFDYADAGLVFPAHGIVASLKTIETRPEVIRRFVAATAKGWLETKQNPDAGLQILFEMFPLLKEQAPHHRLSLVESLRYLDTPNTVGKPFGWQSPDEWREAIRLLAEYMDLKPAASVDTYFTNEFVSK